MPDCELCYNGGIDCPQCQLCGEHYCIYDSAHYCREPEKLGFVAEDWLESTKPALAE